jgi:hypothetical protein
MYYYHVLVIIYNKTVLANKFVWIELCPYFNLHNISLYNNEYSVYIFIYFKALFSISPDAHNSEQQVTDISPLFDLAYIPRDLQHIP